MAVQWLFLVSLVSIFHSTAGEAFDVRSHLSTVSSYNVGSKVVTDAFVPSRLSDDCVPVHLNLVARHGTRSPTKKRIRELDGLAVHLEKLIKDAEEQNLSLKQMPVWMRGWQSPWKGKLRGGELILKGEEELYDLGLRVRERFPDLFNDEYHPDVYVIKASQVPRASASAVAFGMGLFNGKGNLGQGNNRAFAVTSESRASDLMLRFHDCCANYKNFRKKRAPAVDKLKEPILDEITRALVKRFGMNFTKQDASSLWFLCKQEASLLDITDQACGLFTSDEIALLEWTDDLEAFILKGYGNSLNYRMGVPLLQDVLQAMEEAITDSKEKLPLGSYEKARLRFAHAETIVPFSCLLGLFLEGSEFQQILKEQPLDLPPKPPQKRNWRVSSVAPFGGNNMLVLYNCPSNSSSPYYVQVLHNEKPISVPGCGGASFCPFEDFKEKIVAPHLKHDYHTICNVKPEEAVQEQVPSKLSALYNWLFSLGSDGSKSREAEL